MKEPLKVFVDLPNHYAQTNIAFSPDEQLVLTGTSIERDSTTGGLLCFYDLAKLELVSRVGVSQTCSVVQCIWHPKLNQVTAKASLLDVLYAYKYMHPFNSNTSLPLCACIACTQNLKCVIGDF